MIFKIIAVVLSLLNLFLWYRFNKAPITNKGLCKTHCIKASHKAVFVNLFAMIDMLFLVGYYFWFSNDNAIPRTIEEYIFVSAEYIRGMIVAAYMLYCTKFK